MSELLLATWPYGTLPHSVAAAAAAAATAAAATQHHQQRVTAVAHCQAKSHDMQWKRFIVICLCDVGVSCTCSFLNHAGCCYRCDYPAAIKNRPILTAARNKFESCQQMNDAVTATLTTGTAQWQ
jgi:hypothetical protein